MTSPEALAILAKPKHERVAAVADLLRERDDLLRELVVKLDIYAGTATAQTPGALLSRVRAMRTFLLSIGVPVEDITDPPKWAAKLREAERLRAILRDISEALSGGEVPAEDLARTVATVMYSNAAHLERVTRERDEALAALAECDEADARRARIERLEMTADDKGWCINAHAEVIQWMAQTIRAAIAPAENYVEHDLTARLELGDLRIIATTYAPGGQTPHELRVRAEKERDQLRARLTAAEEAQDAAVAALTEIAEDMRRAVWVEGHNYDGHRFYDQLIDALPAFDFGVSHE